jgi:nucleotide-binding universal stress UspA family protein
MAKRKPVKTVPDNSAAARSDSQAIEQERLKLPIKAGGKQIQEDAGGRMLGYIRRVGKVAGEGTPRLLVALDGSSISRRVIDTLVSWRHASQWPLELHLLNVQPLLPQKEARKFLAQWAEKDTEFARAMLEKAGMDYVFHVAMGDPAENVLLRADAIGASQIVMGTRGQNLLGTVLMGSVAYKVVHGAHLPVTLIR